MTKRAKLIVKDTTAIGHFHVNLNHVSQLPQPALFFHLFCKRTQMAQVFLNARCPLCRSTEGNSKLTQTSENHPLALFCPDPPVDSQGKGQCFHYTSSLWRYTHTHTHPFNVPFSGTTRVSRFQKGKTNLDFTEARDSEWQWHQLGHMQVCTSLQTDNYANTSSLSFLQAGCPSCHPTNSVKALKATPWR